MATESPWIQNQASMAFYFRLQSALLLLLAFALAYRHPVWPTPMLAGALLIALVVSKWPWLFAALAPLLLVSGDAYPFTGQLLFQEYDPLLLASAAGCKWAFVRSATRSVPDSTDSPQRAVMGCSMDVLVVFMLMTISLVVSLCIGLYRLPSSEWSDQLSTYFTDQNALRVLKGYLLGGLCVTTFRDIEQVLQIDYRGYLVFGVKAASVYVGLFVLLERSIYESLYDLSNDYRATGPFFTMHIGDQHIDAFLVLCLPLVWFRNGASSMKYLLCGSALSLLLAMVAIYTMSRATIATVLIQATLLGFMSSFFGSSKDVTSRPELKLGRNYFALVGSLSLVAILVVAIGTSEAIRTRLMYWREDLAVRVNHWRDLLFDDRWTTAELSFGHGLGTVPTVLASKKGLPLPPLQWQTTQNGGRVVIKGGWPLYLEQFDWAPRMGPANLAFKATRLDAPSFNAGSAEGAALRVFRCRKSVLHSYDIITHLCPVGNTRDDPIAVARSTPCDVSFDTLPAIEGEAWIRRFRFESVGVMAPQSGTYSIEAMMIERGEARSVSAPGFAGSAPWAFSCDDLLVWRASNALVHLLYEQGVLGCIAWMGLVTVILRRCFSGSQSTTAAFNNRLVLISGLGFSIVAFYGTLIDTPWIVALLIVVLSVNDSERGDSRKAVGC